MKQYFIYQNGEQSGPFFIEELENKKIGREILVWTEGLTDWQKAENIEELNSLFKTVPPPIQRFAPPAAERENPYIQQLETSKKGSSTIKKVGIFLGITILLFVSVCAFVTYQNDQDLKQRELETRIAEQERQVREARIREINNELNTVYQNIEQAKKQLHDISSFHFLRSERERHRQISEAEEIVESWQNKKNNLEKEIKSLQALY